MPNPPVPAVPNAVASESNSGILPISKNIICTTVNVIYIIYNICAVCFTFGTSFPTEGPGLSALIRFILEPPPRGIIASRNTRTPIPPSQ